MILTEIEWVKANSLDDAISIAKDCPFLDVGGTLEVSELMGIYFVSRPGTATIDGKPIG